MLFKWRVLILKLFGGDVDWSSRPYPRSKIWSPLNLKLAKNSCLSNYVYIYNVGAVSIGENSILSDGVKVITATKSYADGKRILKIADVSIGTNVWVASDVFISLGLTLGNNSIVFAKVNLFESLPSDVVVRPLRNYEIEKRH